MDYAAVKWPQDVRADFTRRIPFIDGLRAISILLVVMSHIPYDGAKHVDRWIYGHGDLGVRIFFVLSGFLITGILLTELIRTNQIRLRTFYKKRAFRLMPVYWCYLAVVALASFLGAYRDSASSWIGALTYTRNVVGRGDSVTAHFWSLAVEEQFYFVWPVALLLLAARSCRCLLIFIVSAAPLAIFFRFHLCGQDELCRLLLGGRSILVYMDSILMGCLIGALWVIGAQAGRVIGSFWFRLGLLFLLLFTMSGFAPIAWPYLNFLQAVIVAAYLYSLLGAPSKIELLVLENIVIVYFGRLSYSLYVWHVLFLGQFNKSMFGEYVLFIERYWIPLSFVTAAASYHLLESPLRKYLNQRFIKPQVKPLLITADLTA